MRIVSLCLQGIPIVLMVLVLVLAVVLVFSVFFCFGEAKEKVKED
jgi:flagellar basal body-associated protein FliL